MKVLGKLSMSYSTHIKIEIAALKRLYQRGVSLIELMIIIVIIALLAAVAIPSYQDYVNRTDIAIARVDIEGIEHAIIRFDVTAGRLPNDLTELGMDNLLDPWDQPYEYLNHSGVTGNGKFRKFKGEVPLNSDYDLYSIGRDGASNGPLTAKASKGQQRPAKMTLSEPPMVRLLG